MCFYGVAGEVKQEFAEALSAVIVANTYVYKLNAAYVDDGIEEKDARVVSVDA